MPKSLKDTFNGLDPKSADLADKLQEVLDALPQKLVEMQRDNPGKDVLFTLVPYKSAQGDANVERETGDVVFSFWNKLSEVSDHLDLIFEFSLSVWGDFMGLTIKSGEKNTLVFLQEKGYAATGLQDLYNKIDKYFPDELQQKAREYAEVSIVGHTFTRSIADGVNTGDVLYPEWDYFDQPVTPVFRDRLVYWEVNKNWEKPARKPEFFPGSPSSGPSLR